MKNLLGLLSESNTNVSSTRIIMIVWMLGILVVWSINSLKTGVMIDIPESLQIVIGILMSAKVVQKPFEKQCEVPKTEETK